MRFLALLLLVSFGILLSLAIDKRVEEVLPPYVFSFLIFLYLLAIIKKPHHAFELTFVIYAGIWLLFIVLKKRILPDITSIKKSLSFNSAPGLWCYVVVIVVAMYCYSNHFVNNWDDFHFNATFARDLFLYRGMPVGVKAATGYKTYKPLMQLFYDWGFQAIGRFDEPLMFQYKSFLIFTGMLPVFDCIGKVKDRIGKIIIVIVAAVLPYSFLFEIVDSLSMDAMMGVLFGYCMVQICNRDSRDWFYYIKLIAGFSTLIMIKTTAVMFFGIVAGTYFLILLYENFDGLRTNAKGRFRWLIELLVPSMSAGLLWASWNVFCSVNNNTTYLNNMLDSSVETNSVLPYYGKETIINAIKGLFTLNLNLGNIGATFMSVVFFTIVIFVILSFASKIDVATKIGFGCILLGVIPYFAVLLYTYLFVFYEFEALELSSYDRYLGTYALGMSIVVVCCICKYFNNNMQKVLVIVAVFLVSTLNYPYLYNSMLVNNYIAYRQEMYDSHKEAREEIEGIGDSLEGDANPLIIIGNEDNTVYSRSLDYYAIPMVSSPISIYSYKADSDGDGYADILVEDIDNLYDGANAYTGGAIEDMTERLAEGYDGYVYFTNHFVESGDSSLFNDFIENGEIEKGKLYKSNKGSKLVTY